MEALGNSSFSIHKFWRLTSLKIKSFGGPERRIFYIAREVVIKSTLLEGSDSLQIRRGEETCMLLPFFFNRMWGTGFPAIGKHKVVRITSAIYTITSYVPIR